MSLSSETGATVDQVRQALDDAAEAYQLELDAIKETLLAPVTAEVKRQNAAARKRYNLRRKKLTLYLDALLSEGGCDGTV